ncbi:MAG: alpha/beta hydrolase-fold protein [Gammaproteobacteria bacterium]
MHNASFVSTLALLAIVPCALAQPPSGAGRALTSAELTQQPQTPGAKGDQQRHYFFKGAGSEMPYRLYVPKSYDPNVGAPLIVALHGYGGNQNYFFDIVKELPALCEQYGIIFAAPMGLATDGWYGAPLTIPGAAPRSGGGATPAPGRGPEQETKYRAQSEQDVLNVLELVKHEYKIDPDRTYLMGHSMGGFGTWWLGQKHADLWAAIAPMSGVLPNVDYQLSKLKSVPVMVSIGGAETPAWVEASRKQVDVMKGMGMTAEYFEPEGATHGGMIAPTTPRVFEFLAKQKRAR